LGDIVAERLIELGANADDAQWDSRKRPDGNWQVQITFAAGGRSQVAEWVFDPRRRHIAPDDDQAARLCLPAEDLPGLRFATRAPATATVTPIAPRLGGAPHHPEPRSAHPDPRLAPPEPRLAPPEPIPSARPPISASAPRPSAPPAPAATPAPPAAAAASAGREADGERRQAEPDAPAQERRTGRPARKAAGGRSRRASVPSWDEIMLGNSRQPD
jgi:hypothetical protein